MGLSNIPEDSRLYEVSWYLSIIEPPKQRSFCVMSSICPCDDMLSIRRPKTLSVSRTSVGKVQNACPSKRRKH
jgi:hypothetical protein